MLLKCPHKKTNPWVIFLFSSFKQLIDLHTFSSIRSHLKKTLNHLVWAVGANFKNPSFNAVTQGHFFKQKLDFFSCICRHLRWKMFHLKCPKRKSQRSVLVLVKACSFPATSQIQTSLTSFQQQNSFWSFKQHCFSFCWFLVLVFCSSFCQSALHL